MGLVPHTRNLLNVTFAHANAQMTDKPAYQQGWLRLHLTLTKEKLEKHGQKTIMLLEVKLANIEGELAVLTGYE